MFCSLVLNIKMYVLCVISQRSSQHGNSGNNSLVLKVAHISYKIIMGCVPICAWEAMETSKFSLKLNQVSEMTSFCCIILYKGSIFDLTYSNNCKEN